MRFCEMVYGNTREAFLKSVNKVTDNYDPIWNTYKIVVSNGKIIEFNILVKRK